MSDNDYYETDEGSRQFPWYILTGLILGIGLGLFISLVLSPVRYSDSAPSTLDEDFKAIYRMTILQAYEADQDLVRARQRLELLDGAAVQETLAAQAQLALTAGDEPLARSLAELAAALSSLQATEAGLTAQPPTSPAAPTVPSEAAQPTETSASQPSPSPTQGMVFLLVDRQQVCDPTLQEGLLQIELRDSSGEPVPGVQISIAWDGGLETFYTGLKPSVGTGYADYQMSPGVTYSLRVGSSQTISDLAAPECSADNGSSYTGGIRLVFGQ